MTERLQNLKMLLLDVDGTLTDGGIYIDERGNQSKKFNVKDGLGIKLAMDHGVDVGIISHSSSSGMIETRAKMLGMTFCYVGKEPKLEVLNKWCEENNWQIDQVGYIGDDLTDIPIMEAVGLSACPADAVKHVKAVADILLQFNGGEGCVREFVDEFLIPAKSQKK